MTLKLLWPGAGDSNAIPNITSVPGQPVVSASVSDGQVALSWAAVDTASSYQPYVNTVAYGSPVSSLSVVVTGLSNGTAYNFTVSAVNAVGQGLQSAIVTATPAAPVSAPTAPVLSSVTPGDGQVVMEWSPSAGATSYQPQVNSTDTGPSTTATTATVGGLTNGTLYTLTVTASNSAGTSPPSNSIGVIPQGTSLPSVAAQWSDLLVDSEGANLHTTFTGWVYAVTPDPASGYASAAQAIKAKLDYIGIRHVRDNMGLNNNTQKTALTTICAGGIRVLFSSWDTAQGLPAAGYASSIAAWYQATYMSVGEGVEGFNEPNQNKTTSWPSDTQTFQQQLWGAFHPLGVTVLTAPLGSSKGAATLGSMDGKADICAVHSYPGGQKPSTNMGTDLSNCQVLLDTAKPRWLTECGYHNAIHAANGFPPVPENVSGTYAPILFLEAFRRGVARSYWYELADDRRDDALTNIQKHFGLERWGAQPSPAWSDKPAATALHNMNSLLSDPGTPYAPANLNLDVSGGDTSLRWLLFGKRDGSYVLCLWRDVSIYTPSTTADGGVPVTVTAQPITVTLASSKTVTVYQPDASATGTAQGSVTGCTVSLAGSLLMLTIV